MKHGGERKGSQPISQEEGRVPAYEYWSWCLGSGNLSVWRRGRAPHTSQHALQATQAVPVQGHGCKGKVVLLPWCYNENQEVSTQRQEFP